MTSARRPPDPAISGPDWRNWIRREPAFALKITIWTLLPDEWDVLELGPRVAVAHVEEHIAEMDSVRTAFYRRRAE